MSTLTLKKPADARADAQADSSVDLRLVMQKCADDIDCALALKIGYMDSESRVIEINATRDRMLQAVAARLRLA